MRRSRPRRPGARFVAVGVVLGLVSAACASEPAQTSFPPSTTIEAAGAAVPPVGEVSTTSVVGVDRPEGSLAGLGSGRGASARTPSAWVPEGSAPPGQLAPRPPTVAAAGPTPTTLPPDECPSPKTCRAYVLTSPPSLWPRNADGRAEIRYWLHNPRAVTELPDELFQGAVAAAMASWVEAAPALLFTFEGWTDVPPAIGDGVNTVGFNQGCGAGCGVTSGDRERPGFLGEADIMLGPSPTWSWTPCGGADGSCTPANVRANDGIRMTNDLQAVLTHELGHWLRLSHPDVERYPYQTMNPFTEGWTDRKHVTLALGDVLGARELYPCDCPLPPIYDP